MRASRNLGLLVAAFALVVGGCFAQQQQQQPSRDVAASSAPNVGLDEFLQVSDDSEGNATVAGFLGVSSPEVEAAAATTCTPATTIAGVLRSDPALAPYDLNLTLSALGQTGIASVLTGGSGAQESYVVVAPTNRGWVDLRESILDGDSDATRVDSLQGLLTYQIFGTTNRTVYDGIARLVEGGSGLGAINPYYVTVPLEMLDGNLSVLQTEARKSGGRTTINGAPVLAHVPACNGIILVTDKVLLPGVAPAGAGEDGREQAAAEAFAAAGSNPGARCGDIPPPSPPGLSWTCADQERWGKCVERWMWDGRYCADTCGFCGLEESPYAYAPALPTGAAAAGAQAQPQTQAEAQNEIQYALDPCACSPDGLSGKANTGVAGCQTMTIPQLTGMAYAKRITRSEDYVDLGRQLGSRFDGLAGDEGAFNYCYVVNPKKCKKFTEKSPFFKGARWRFC